MNGRCFVCGKEPCFDKITSALYSKVACKLHVHNLKEDAEKSCRGAFKHHISSPWPVYVDERR